jgi:hypothetical protein
MRESAKKFVRHGSASAGAARPIPREGEREEHEQWRPDRLRDFKTMHPPHVPGSLSQPRKRPHGLVNRAPGAAQLVLKD